MRVIFIVLILLLTSCYGTYYITDSEYDNVRKEHLAITYHNNSIYWGWNNGFYYYYGKPHYYPWYYYYNTCPPSYYNVNTHIIIKKPVNKPNRPVVKPTHRPKTNVRTNINRNRTIMKSNKSNKTRVTIKRNKK